MIESLHSIKTRFWSWLNVLLKTSLVLLYSKNTIFLNFFLNPSCCKFVSLRLIFMKFYLETQNIVQYFYV